MVELGDLREGILPGRPRGGRRARRSALPGPRPARHRHQPRVPERGRARRRATWPSCRDLAASLEADARHRPSTSCPAATRPTSTGPSAAATSGGSTTSGSASRSCSAASRSHRRPIDGLHTDAFTPRRRGDRVEGEADRGRGATSQQTAFGSPARRAGDRGDRGRVIVALGRQDVDPDGLDPPPGMTILGASSDHLVVDPGRRRLAGRRRGQRSGSTTAPCCGP